MILLNILDIYVLFIIARVIISWVYPNPHSQFVQIIVKVTEPLLGPIRRFLMQHLKLGMIDLSPMIAILLVQLVRQMLVSLLLGRI